MIISSKLVKFIFKIPSVKEENLSIFDWELKLFIESSSAKIRNDNSNKSNENIKLKNKFMFSN